MYNVEPKMHISILLSLTSFVLYYLWAVGMLKLFVYNVEGKIKIPRELVQGLSSGPRAQSVYNVEPIIYVSVIVSLGSFVAD